MVAVTDLKPWRANTLMSKGETFQHKGNAYEVLERHLTTTVLNINSSVYNLINLAGSGGGSGADGRGITGIVVNSSGHLIVTYTDSTTEDAGLVRGTNGTNGRGVTSFVIDGSEHLIVTYTDATTADLGQVVGPAGADGGNNVVLERLAVSAPNTLVATSQIIDTTKPVKLIVNHAVYTGADLPTPFTITGPEAITWNAANAGFSLATTDNVIVEYFSVPPG